jgi:hypothetical protein
MGRRRSANYSSGLVLLEIPVLQGGVDVNSGRQFWFYAIDPASEFSLR